MKKILMIIVAFTMIPMLAACGGNNESEGDEPENNTEEAETASEPVEVTEEEKVDEDKSVVRVNDTEIKGDEYNSIYQQLKMTAQMYQQDVSDVDMLQEQAINVLVQQELINQDASDQGIEISDEEVTSELEAFKEENGEDQFTALLDQFQLTEAEYKEQLSKDLLINRYIESEFDTEVSNEEIEEYYDQVKEQNDELPELDEVKDEIKDGLQQQKEQEQLQEKIEELKETADIETLI